jgi:hypothetical protein
MLSGDIRCERSSGYCSHEHLETRRDRSPFLLRVHPEWRSGVKAAQMAYDFAVTQYWIAAVGDPVRSITLIEAGRAMVAEAEELRPTRKPAPRKSR